MQETDDADFFLLSWQNHKHSFAKQSTIIIIIIMHPSRLLNYIFGNRFTVHKDSNSQTILVALSGEGTLNTGKPRGITHVN